MLALAKVTGLLLCEAKDTTRGADNDMGWGLLEEFTVVLQRHTACNRHKSDQTRRVAISAGCGCLLSAAVAQFLSEWRRSP